MAIPIECGDAFNYGFIGICVFTFWCFLFKTRFEYLKRKKLEERGASVNGIATNLRKQKTNKSVSYYIDYEFNAAIGKSKLLVDGYLRSDEENMKNIIIPMQLWNVILSFYGKDTLKTPITDTHEVDMKLWNPTEIGDEIEIIFDPQDPKEYNIPQVEYESRGPCHWMCFSFGCILALMLSLVLERSWCLEPTGRGGIDLLWIWALFFIYTVGFIGFGFALTGICLCVVAGGTCIQFFWSKCCRTRRANNDYTQLRMNTLVNSTDNV